MSGPRQRIYPKDDEPEQAEIELRRAKTEIAEIREP
jgi:hypothetical protein